MLLARGGTNALLPIEPMAAASGLLALSFVPFYDAGLMASAVDFLGTLSEEIPCYRLPFVPDADVVRFVIDEVGRADG